MLLLTHVLSSSYANPFLGTGLYCILSNFIPMVNKHHQPLGFILSVAILCACYYPSVNAFYPSLRIMTSSTSKPISRHGTAGMPMSLAAGGPRDSGADEGGQGRSGGSGKQGGGGKGGARGPRKSYNKKGRGKDEPEKSKDPEKRLSNLNRKLSSILEVSQIHR